jgi:ABC-type Na+ transport system ATPase subunit NatA
MLSRGERRDSILGSPHPWRSKLALRRLSVAYGAKKAVIGVSLQIARGEIFGLLGPNGAGKTSTLSAMEGLIKPQSGAVLLDGLDIRRHPSQAKARLGVQLQATSFQSQLTIRQIVRLYAGLYGVKLSDGEITEGLREIGLEREASKPFKQLSGGQQQRLALYVAVVHQPALLLLDEPTAGLDPQSRRQLWGRIEDIRPARPTCRPPRATRSLARTLDRSLRSRRGAFPTSRGRAPRGPPADRRATPFGRSARGSCDHHVCRGAQAA